MFLPAPMNSGEKTAVAEELKSTGSSDALGTELLTMTDMTEDEGKAEGADLHSEHCLGWAERVGGLRWPLTELQPGGGVGDALLQR